MTELLVIRLTGTQAATEEQAETAQVEWLIVDSVTGKRSKVQTGTIADVEVDVPGRKVVVLVPGADILLAEPVVPLKGGVKPAQVVPFALEEQLAQDVDDLHFAFGKRDARPGIPVAVTSHARMESWLAALQSAGIHADTMFAETTVLPVTPNGVTLVIDSGRVYMRREQTPGTVLEVHPLIEALQLALASGEEAREHVTIYLDPADYERERELLEEFREFTASLQLKLLPEGPLPLFAANIPGNASANTSINLLQGKYAVKTQFNVSFAPWRPALSLIAVCVALHLGLKGWQYVHFKKTEAQLNEQITQLFQQALPADAAPKPQLARKQMESRLAALRSSGSTGGMLNTLNILGEALTQSPGVDIEALAYRNNITDLRVLAPSVDALDRIQQVASERGVAAEIQSANPRDTKIEGRLQLKNAGA